MSDTEMAEIRQICRQYANRFFGIGFFGGLVIGLTVAFLAYHLRCP